MKKKIKLIFLLAVLLCTAAFMFASCKNKDDNDAKKTQLEVTTEPELSNNGGEENNTDNTDMSELIVEAAAAETTEAPKRMTFEDFYGSEKDPPKYYCYLTGLECTRAYQRKRPVSIVINNIKPAMPNVGISKADIIYECIVEGGATRLMMILADYEDVNSFGSVRSSREYFIDLSRTHDTIYVHAGGNPQDYTEFYNRPGIERIDGVNMNFPNTFFRDTYRRNTLKMAIEHTLMTSGEGITAGINQQNYRTTLNREFRGAFNFHEAFTDISESGESESSENKAVYVAVPYSAGFKPEFMYNSSDKLYYRNQFGEAHVDGETGEQIKFENVIIIFAQYTPYRENAIAIAEGHLSCNLTGTGYGFYISGGKYKTIKWEKENRDGALKFYNLDNSDLFLNPGKSFICVTSTAYNRSVTIN